MSPLSARQLKHIAELSQKRRSATHFSPLDEQTSLARLAATGDAKAFKEAMDAQPEVDPGLAVV